ncbi:MAG: hypothetical protein AAGJ95_09640 [Cyanobacteria bacterium J06554_11]
MTKAKADRTSFSLRLQPYDGSLLAEVVHYLNSLDRAEAMRRVEGVLVMALLTQARLYAPNCSDAERRRCCIEACDALEKHASMLRQLVGVEMPMRTGMPSYGMGVLGQQMHEGAELSVDSGLDEGEDDEVRSPPKSKIDAISAAEDVNSLFG